MIITGVQRKRRQLYQLELDNEPAVEVDVRTFDESPYREGGAIDDDELYALLLCSRRRRAREKALWLLSSRDYAAGEMIAKLAPEAGQDIAEETVAVLAEQGLIREEAYARRLAEEYCGRRHYPQRRAVQEMVRRGVDRDIAEQAVSENGSDDLQEALALLQKKRYTDTDKDKLRQKAFGFLARQGFDYSAARRAVGQWIDEYAAGEPGDGGFADDR